jgi:hypothetical protein
MNGNNYRTQRESLETSKLDILNSHRITGNNTERDFKKSIATTS